MATKLFRPKMDTPAKLVFSLSVFLPVFLLASGILWSNGTVVGISLILMTLTTTFIVWPLSNAFYLITDKYLIINYFRPGKISFADFESAEKVGGKHKYALTGFGYYCTNFKDRVLIRVRGKGKTKEYVLSPPNPDEFVELLNRNKAIYRRMYQEKES